MLRYVYEAVTTTRQELMKEARMARRSIVRSNTNINANANANNQAQKKVQAQQNKPMAGGGGGGGTINLDRATDDKATKGKEAGVSTVTFAPEQKSHNWEDRLNALNNKFHEIRSSRRRGKHPSLKVIDDARITPDERLKLFVQAATQMGYSRDEAIEYGIARMERKGHEIAGSNKSKEITLNELLGG